MLISKVCTYLLKKNQLHPSSQEWTYSICRFFIFLNLWYYTDFAMLLNRGSYPEVLWLPQGFLKIFPVALHFNEITVFSLNILFHFFALLSCIGRGSSITALVFWILCFFSNIYGDSFGKTTHGIMPILLCGLFFLSSKNVNRDEITKKILMCRSIFCFIFFSAGIAKLANSGFHWIQSNTLTDFVIVNHIYRLDRPHLLWKFSAIQFFLKYSKIFAALPLVGLATELIVPLSLFSKRLRPFLIFGILLLQAGIYILLSLNFSSYSCLYFLWIDWGYYVEKLKNFRKAASCQ